MGEPYRMMRLTLIILALSIFGCSTDNVNEGDESKPIKGSWQLFERGYSPGDRYIVEEVPLVPEQLIHFNADSTFESNIEGYKLFNQFRLREENSTLVLILYSDPGINNRDSVSFEVSHSGQRLELRAKGCIEGCHEAYRPVPERNDNQ